MAKKGLDYTQVLVESRSERRRWLSRNHQHSPGVWLARWKKDSGHPHVSYAGAVEEAICHGWVDSRPKSLNARQSLILVTPRKPTSNWSRSNKARAEELIQAGRMAPAGQRAVDAAKANGRWDPLNTVEALIEPVALSRALRANAQARQNWKAFPRSTRRAILEWIGSAKTEATRRRRVERTVSDAARNVRANQWRQPRSKNQ
jgi:uncharacterized protein YdeI (YjbR/CyaY-like superfamily)